MTNTDREKIKEALNWARVLVKFHVKPEKCVSINDDMKSAEEIYKLLVDALASQAATKPAGGEWLPIESAPRDGTEILGYWSLGHGSHGCTKFLKGEWVNPEDCDDEYCAPDFWQPLPAPPLTRKENGE